MGTVIKTTLVFFLLKTSVKKKKKGFVFFEMKQHNTVTFKTLYSLKIAIFTQ